MPLKIVFMGTPDFSVPCLERIIADNHKVLGVFCQPDRPKGRGMALEFPSVKKAALQAGLPVFQPLTLRDGDALQILRGLSPDVIVVVAYGRILPVQVLELPPMGCINGHASILPRWRGAAPIQWSLISGDEVTGVTTIYMSETLDGGDIILTQQTDIQPDETSGRLFERLSTMCAGLISQTLTRIEDGSAPRIPQDIALATSAPPIKKNMSRLDFNATPKDFCNFVRGMNPSPGAVAHFAGAPVKIHKAVPVPDFSGAPGQILHPKRLIVACGDGAVELITVQAQGKKPMDGAAWRNGLRRADGESFS